MNRAGDRSALVEQYAHLGRSHGTSRSVFQNGANLFKGDAGKPLNKL